MTAPFATAPASTATTSGFGVLVYDIGDLASSPFCQRLATSSSAPCCSLSPNGLIAGTGWRGSRFVLRGRSPSRPSRGDPGIIPLWFQFGGLLAWVCRIRLRYTWLLRGLTVLAGRPVRTLIALALFRPLVCFRFGNLAALYFPLFAFAFPLSFGRRRRLRHRNRFASLACLQDRPTIFDRPLGCGCIDGRGSATSEIRGRRV